MILTAAHYLNTLIVAELKAGQARFVRSYAVRRDGTYSVELTDAEHEAIRLESGPAQTAIDELHMRLRDADDEPISYLRAIGALVPWKATYRTKPTGRKLKTIGAYFARSYEGARDYALRIVDEETDGQGVLVSVEMTDDPRD